MPRERKGMGRLTRLLIEAMAKHLPPSASTLRLLDVGGLTGAVLTEMRQDLEVIVAPDNAAAWSLEANSVDAVLAYGRSTEVALLEKALDALRPGGRLVLVDPDAEVQATFGEALTGAGYVRILVETAAECPLPVGVLMRGEKPHTTADTLARVQSVASRDAHSADFANFKGRYVHLLVRQLPNKPVWALEAGEEIVWQAAAVLQNGETRLLAFSSLSKAVSFMQPAVLEGLVQDVNKVGKFSRATALAWTQPVLLNPTLDAVRAGQVVFLPVDAATAEAPDE